MIDKLGKKLALIFKYIPKGIIIFFSSYELMKKCYKVWKILFKGEREII